MNSCRSSMIAGVGVGALVVAASLGCSDQLGGPAGIPKSRLLVLLTPEVAAQVDGNGRFANLQVPADGGTDRISSARAAQLAEAWVKTFGPTAEQFWSSARGSRIIWSSLHRCRRIEHAASAYELDVEPPNSIARSHLGSVYLLTYCGESGRPELLVSVSSSATLLTVVSDGRIARAPSQSLAGLIRAYGIPLTDRDGVIPTAEEAVELAVGSTGRRASSVPQLVRAPHPYSPQFSSWKIRLEGLEGDGGVSKLDSAAYVGIHPELRMVRRVWIADEAAGSGTEVVVLPDPASGGPHDVHLLRRRLTRPPSN